MYLQIQSIKTEEGKLGQHAGASNQAVILKFDFKIIHVHKITKLFSAPENENMLWMLLTLHLQLNY